MKCNLALKITALYGYVLHGIKGNHFAYNNRPNVHCVFLDATKAFDRVEYCKLFELLLERDMPPVVKVRGVGGLSPLLPFEPPAIV